MLNNKIFALSIALLILIAGSVMAGPPPLGEPNEVWVTLSSSGDTLYVGQHAGIQIYFANSAEMYRCVLAFQLRSQDGAQWDWVIQPDSLWDVCYEPCAMSPELDSRFWGECLDWNGFGWGPVTDTAHCFEFGGESLTLPFAPAGSLEHAATLHLRPTSTGTICIDTAFWPPADDQWYFDLSTGTVWPAWNGPFCFTVVEPVLGDVNCDGVANIGDAVYLINWIFRGGPPPCR